MHFFSIFSSLKVSYLVPDASAFNNVKPDAANQKRRFILTSGLRQYNTVANLWRYPIRRRIILFWSGGENLQLQTTH